MKIYLNQAIRKTATSKSLAHFCFYYLSHYIKNAVPNFHWAIYTALESIFNRIVEIIAFRGSAKSTIASLAYPLFCAVTGKKKFIIIISDTHSQAKQIITNLIYELENNQKLIDDYGPFKNKTNEWTATEIVLSNGVKIISRSTGQQVRGLRHLQFRPDLIICDDIENSESVRSKEQRDKTEDWFWNDVFPTLDTKDGKLVVLGNFLHVDSFVNRLKRKLKTQKIGVSYSIPLLDALGNNEWEDVYTPERVEQLKKNGRFFQREYLLKIIAPDDQPIKKIKHYQERPEIKYFRRISIGVDLAISKADSADNASITVVGQGEGFPIYTLENIAGKWGFNGTLERIKSIYDKYQLLFPHCSIALGVEDVAYQHSAIEEISRRWGIPVTPIKQTKDKRARMETIAPYFDNEQILLPDTGCEDLEIELLGFGVEAHDDRPDSLEIAVRQVIDYQRATFEWL